MGDVLHMGGLISMMSLMKIIDMVANIFCWTRYMANRGAILDKGDRMMILDMQKIVNKLMCKVDMWIW